MRTLNDYACDHCGLKEEHFIENDIKVVECSDCGNPALKVRNVPNFSLPGNDPHGLPTAYDAWERKRKQKMAEEKRSES